MRPRARGLGSSHSHGTPCARARHASLQGRGKKSARAESKPAADEAPKGPTTTRGAAKSGGERPAGRQLRVKLTGAPPMLREGAGAISSDEPSAEAPAAGIAASAPAGHFAPRTQVILTNGRISYEAEVRARCAAAVRAWRRARTRALTLARCRGCARAWAIARADRALRGAPRTARRAREEGPRGLAGRRAAAGAAARRLRPALGLLRDLPALAQAAGGVGA